MEYQICGQLAIPFQVFNIIRYLITEALLRIDANAIGVVAIQRVLTLVFGRCD